MPSDNTTRHALIGALSLSTPRTGSVFYAKITKTTRDFFWYQGPYSSKKVARATHVVRFFDTEEEARKVLAEMGREAGKPEVDRLRAELETAQTKVFQSFARQMADWKTGDE